MKYGSPNITRRYKCHLIRTHETNSIWYFAACGRRLPIWSGTGFISSVTCKQCLAAFALHGNPRKDRKEATP